MKWPTRATKWAEIVLSLASFVMGLVGIWVTGWSPGVKWMVTAVWTFAAGQMLD